jgi:hypothetical protein
MPTLVRSSQPRQSQGVKLAADSLTKHLADEAGAQAPASFHFESAQL